MQKSSGGFLTIHSSAHSQAELICQSWRLTLWSFINGTISVSEEQFLSQNDGGGGPGYDQDSLPYKCMNVSSLNKA